MNLFLFSENSNNLANHLRKCSPTSDDIHGTVQRLWLYTEYYLIKFQVYYSKLTTDVRKIYACVRMNICFFVYRRCLRELHKITKNKNGKQQKVILLINLKLSLRSQWQWRLIKVSNLSLFMEFIETKFSKNHNSSVKIF